MDRDRIGAVRSMNAYSGAFTHCESVAAGYIVRAWNKTSEQRVRRSNGDLHLS